jgi:hypothetical protein
MYKTHIINRQQIEGEVQSNDGDVAEIQTNGIEGIEEDLLLDTIEIVRDETKETPEQFQRTLQIGMWVDIITIITAQQPVVEGTSASPRSADVMAK